MALTMRSLDVKITRDEYNLWQKDFTWEALHGIRYGQSFCNHFNINDNKLYYTRDSVWADDYIQETYIR
jgi:hypothetical protein